MAGKHMGMNGYSMGDTTPGIPPTMPWDKRDRAYAEGRAVGAAGGSAGDNPHASGTPENVAWGVGLFYAAKIIRQYQTAVPGTE